MNNTVLGALWMIGAIVSFSSMAIAGRAVSLSLDTFEIMLFRSIIGLFVVLGIASIAGTRSQVTRRHMGLHVLRNISHFAGQNLWFYAITVIPLAQVFAVEFTSPLWVIMLSPLVLGEKLTQTRIITALIGFCGILVVARPGTMPFDWGIVAAAAAAIGFAGSAVFTKRLTRTESITCILFYLTAMQLVFGLICAGYDGQIAFPDLSNWSWIVLIALAGLVAHYCLTKALSLAPATVVIPVDFVRLPLIALIGMLMYSEPLDIWVFVGAVIIFGANYVNIVRETKAMQFRNAASEHVD
ncbi:MAG: DMT family transporter [Rhodobacteraceae bacterium]|nr:DMT family transporter [Paracoccaceae bacterium]